MSCPRRHWLPRIVALATLLASTISPTAARSRAAAIGEISIRVMTYNIESGRGAIDGTVAAIRAQSPDIAALQEVDVHWAERSGFADQAAILAERLAMQVRFARIYRTSNGDPGKPPREFGVALLSRFPIVAWRNDTLTRLSTQEANPVPALEPLLKHLHDAWPASSGAGLTYPADNPVKRIDYVLTSSQFSVRSARVPVTDASDHRPVVIDLVLR
jgi:endonuclease/exonuclease/phosphatase family metal-dependent hydrolase